MKGVQLQVKNGHDKIRKTWDIDPETKIHGDKKEDRAFQRRKFRQSLNNLVGRISPDEFDDIDIDDQE